MGCIGQNRQKGWTNGTGRVDGTDRTGWMDRQDGGDGTGLTGLDGMGRDGLIEWDGQTGQKVRQLILGGCCDEFEMFII